MMNKNLFAKRLLARSRFAVMRQSKSILTCRLIRWLHLLAMTVFIFQRHVIARSHSGRDNPNIRINLDCFVATKVASRNDENILPNVIARPHSGRGNPYLLDYFFDSRLFAMTF